MGLCRVSVGQSPVEHVDFLDEGRAHALVKEPNVSHLNSRGKIRSFLSSLSFGEPV